jgi:hypothetical protein
MSNNFVNDAVIGKMNESIGATDPLQYIWESIKEWWDGLDVIQKYAIIAGAGLVAVGIIVAVAMPKRTIKRKPTPEEEMVSLLKMKMMKELVA